jgi:hypothetical protein
VRVDALIERPARDVREHQRGEGAGRFEMPSIRS